MTEITGSRDSCGARAQTPYSLKVAYDAQAFDTPNQGGGKGAQLKNILGSHLREFVGLAPPATANTGLPVIRKGLANYYLWQQISLPALIRQTRPDIFLAPYNIAPIFIPKSTQLVLVLHDLIPFDKFQSIGWQYEAILRYWRLVIPLAVSRASVVLTVSQYSRQRIIERFPKANVQVIPCTIPESWYEAEKRKPADQRGNFILLPAAISPHKNIHRALEAYASLRSRTGTQKEPPFLRVVGVSSRGSSTLRPLLNKLKIAEMVEFLPYLDLPKLQGQYRDAEVVFFPSMAEGFGIPLLEAMSAGTPVVCSNAASLPEVGGNVPLYCDPSDPQNMGRVLSNSLSDQALREEMVLRGVARAALFHPARIGEEVDQFWQQLASA